MIHQRTRQLHESEQRLHAILDNAAEGILTVDAAGKVGMANRAAADLLGYRDRDLIEQTFDSLFVDDAKVLFFQDYLHVGKNPDGRIFREVTGKRLDGTEVAVELAIAELQRDDQSLFIVIIHDLTERKRADRLKGEFVSTVSHELRTPLTSIRGSLGLLVGGVGGALPAASQKLLHLANENAKRLSDLINDILDFEKLEYGGMLIKLEPCNLEALVREVIIIIKAMRTNFQSNCCCFLAVAKPRA